MEFAAEGLILTPQDERYIEIHRRAALRASEHASGMLDAAERHYREGEWELAAQAEESAYAFQQQASDELARVDVRLERARQEGAAPAHTE